LEPLEFGYYEQYRKKMEEIKENEELERERSEEEIVKRSIL
jgi:hypothetical protein